MGLRIMKRKAEKQLRRDFREELWIRKLKANDEFRVQHFERCPWAKSAYDERIKQGW